MTTPADRAGIRSGTTADLRPLAELLTEAFLHGDFAPWLIAHLDTRHRVYRPYFAMLTEHALQHGHVDMTDDGTAAALWYPITSGPPPEPDDYPHRLAAITGPALTRFQALDHALHTAHPYDQPHSYLALLAVHPDRQRQGHGSRLLDHHHTRLDHLGTPAYLEATGIANRRLYLRHGYRARTPVPIGRAGLRLHPMWRSAQPSAI
ncbi:GNAT family N-acetyltransferase [Krasilnikovia sp. MM14-A1004]|uniref:GNAT family N-acetyltransferase n=1 Tax=Krasilnikovia sp. MM14-A1004 TaxID=3373541 RepID=UPI00399CD5B7